MYLLIPNGTHIRSSHFLRYIRNCKNGAVSIILRAGPTSSSSGGAIVGTGSDLYSRIERVPISVDEGGCKKMRTTKTTVDALYCNVHAIFCVGM